MKDRYGVRIGDDGRWYAKFDTVKEARNYAAKFSTENWARQAQVRDFETGQGETWRNGECTYLLNLDNN